MTYDDGLHLGCRCFVEENIALNDRHHMYNDNDNDAPCYICRLGFLKKNFYLSATVPSVDVIVWKDLLNSWVFSVCYILYNDVQSPCGSVYTLWRIHLGERRKRIIKVVCVSLNILFLSPFLPQFIAHIFKMFVIDTKFADFTISSV